MPKTKTSRKPHDKNKIPHNKTKNLTVKPKTSQQKPNTSRQKQIPTAKPKLFCLICCEVLGFAMRYFVFAVRFLVLPWCFCFCLDSCGPPYSKGIKFRLEKQVVKKSSEISNCLFSVTMSVLLWELHEKFLQFDWIRAVAFQLNLKYLHVKITNLLLVVV